MKKLAIIINSIIGITVLLNFIEQGVLRHSPTVDDLDRIIVLFIFGINLLALVKSEKTLIVRMGMVTSSLLVILGVLGLASAIMGSGKGLAIFAILMVIFIILPGVLNIMVLRKIGKKQD